MGWRQFTAEYEGDIDYSHHSCSWWEWIIILVLTAITAYGLLYLVLSWLVKTQ